MFKKLIYFFFIILLSCSSADKPAKVKKPEKIYSAEILYKTALKEYDKGNLENAIDFLKKIEQSHLYSVIAPKAKLMIAYLYYEANEYQLSLTTLNKFKELYPANKNLPYADFLVALCLYEEINLTSKDQTNTLLALKQFNSIINKYPNSIYAEEAKIRIDLINEQLAGKEMYIARYYISKEKWISAILRLQTIIEKYSSTIFIEEALHRMVEINYRIGNIETSKKYAAILGYNFNSTEWYKKTYKIVGDQNYLINNKKRKISFLEKLKKIFTLNQDD